MSQPNKSPEEMKIRDELEEDIETNMEEEIKDGIYHLALRLHRLYQQKKERNEKALPNERSKNSTTLAEININIQLEGGTKIQINEIKKEAGRSGRGRPKTTSDSSKIDGVLAKNINVKKVDWANTLRSSRPSSLSTKTGHAYANHQAKKCDNNNGTINQNVRRNCSSVPRSRKGNVDVMKKGGDALKN